MLNLDIGLPQILQGLGTQVGGELEKVLLLLLGFVFGLHQGSVEKSAELRQVLVDLLTPAVAPKVFAFLQEAFKKLLLLLWVIV